MQLEILDWFPSEPLGLMPGVEYTMFVAALAVVGNLAR
jgi:hypothetical protein